MPDTRLAKVLWALAFATALLAGVVSYFAYSPPDALEHSIETYAPVTEDAAGGEPSAESPADDGGYAGAFPDYGVSALEEKPFLSGGVAGIIGVAATFAVLVGLGALLKRGNRSRREEGSSG